MTIASPTIADLTSATLEGTGVFDVLMKANKAHLEDQFTMGRIKGPEYATVYLGSLEQVLNNAVQFLLAKDKVGLEAQLLEVQLQIAQVELEKAGVELEKAQVEKEILEAQLLKIPAEIDLLEAQTALAGQQKLNLIDELLTATEQRLKIIAETALVTQQELNAEVENDVLVAQKCKLQAEYDVLMETKLKTAQETALLTWKVTTEKAQTSATGVDDNSVIGKQKILYAKQAAGFDRDAEQKAAKIMVDTWNVRRTTDEGTVADSTNMLYDTGVGRAVTKMLSGVGA